MFQTLFCSSSGRTVYTANGIFLCQKHQQLTTAHKAKNRQQITRTGQKQNL
jgi:hypothetical protein